MVVLNLVVSALSSSGRAQLLPSEVELRIFDAVDAEFPGNLSEKAQRKLVGGLLCVTTHRLIWAPPTGTACRAAHEAALASVVEVLTSSTVPFFGSRTPRLRLRVRVDASGYPTSAPSTFSCLLFFAFRGKQTDYEVVSNTLAKEAWAKAVPRQPRSPLPPPGGVVRHDAVPAGFRSGDAGVAGILRRQEELQQELTTSLAEAFTDLAALAERAREVLAFAERTRAAQQRDLGAGAAAGEAAFALSLGITSPVTRLVAGALFHQQLALQLADFLGPAVERSHGVLPLPEAYCLFNRARGTELVSPADLLKAAGLWAQEGAHLQLRRFPSGMLAVTGGGAHSEASTNARLVQLAAASPRVGVGTADAARCIGFSPLVAREQLLCAEADGLLVRDDAPDGLRFFTRDAFFAA